LDAFFDLLHALVEEFKLGGLGQTAGQNFASVVCDEQCVLELG